MASSVLDSARAFIDSLPRSATRAELRRVSVRALWDSRGVAVVVSYHRPTSALNDLALTQPSAPRVRDEKDPASALVDPTLGGKGGEIVPLVRLDLWHWRGPLRVIASDPVVL